MTRRASATTTIHAALLALLCGAGGARAAIPAAAAEQDVKAAFLFQFTRFVEWPAGAFSSADAPLLICVLGRNPLSSALQRISQGEMAYSHALVVTTPDRVEDLDECHIVFVGGADDATVGKALSRLSGKRILTVSDTADFARRGGVIGFVLADGKLRLQINRGSAETAQLRISAKLLRLAEQMD